MCGRFETKRIEQELLDLFLNAKLKAEIEQEKDNFDKGDSVPTQKIMSVLLKKDIYKITKVNWGIKFKEDSPLIFNSRIETIKEKKYWSSLFANNRCIVPMSGFYEWHKEGNKKIKYRIHLPDSKIFFVPAIFYKNNENKLFASLITTIPNDFIKQIHHRMPVILDFKKAIDFLNNEAEENFKLCIPYDDKKKMEMELD